jgi:menaquinone-dependent protoporphyrinogen oxidase
MFMRIEVPGNVVDGHFTRAEGNADGPHDRGRAKELQMKVLIVVASRHHATREIADAVGQGLREAGLEVNIRAADDAPNVEGYDAVVLGSAVYMGHWLPAGRAFIRANRAQFTSVPVWLFSSGPLEADEARSAAPPVELNALMEDTGARNHRIFAGKLDKSQLGFGERLVLGIVKAPEGDFRDWQVIRAYAHDIASALRVAEMPHAY